MEIKTAKYLISSPNVELCPKPDRPEYAFIGRSNVGKSSLINMLTRNATLAKTSGNPGKTQMINHFEISGIAEEGKDIKPVPFYFVDLPGYGFAKVSIQQRKNWEKMIRGYLIERKNLVTIFALLDARLEPQQIDLDFLGKLGEWKVPFNMIFTKADKVPQRESSRNMRSFIDEMRKDWEFIPRSFLSSAMKFRGRKEILAYVDELNKEWYNNIDSQP